MKQGITPYNFDEILFEYFEGTLNDAEKKNFLDFVEKNPSFKKDFELWGQSVVASDNIEVPQGLEDLFTKKESFWKSFKGRGLLAAGAVTIAASVVLFSNKEELAPANATNNKPSAVSYEKQDSSATEEVFFNSAHQSINPKNSATISSPKTSKILPLVFEKNQPTVESNGLIYQSKADSLKPSEKANENSNLVEPNATSSSQKTIPVQEPNDKNGKLDLKIEDKKLGHPKNIIEMEDKLDEN